MANQRMPPKVSDLSRIRRSNEPDIGALDTRRLTAEQKNILHAFLIFYFN